MVVQLATKGACSIPGLLLLMFLPQFYKQFIAAIKKLHLERGLRMSLKGESELIHILHILLCVYVYAISHERPKLVSKFYIDKFQFRSLSYPLPVTCKNCMHVLRSIYFDLFVF